MIIENLIFSAKIFIFFYLISIVCLIENREKIYYLSNLFRIFIRVVIFSLITLVGIILFKFSLNYVFLLSLFMLPFFIFLVISVIENKDMHLLAIAKNVFRKVLSYGYCSCTAKLAYSWIISLLAFYILNKLATVTQEFLFYQEEIIQYFGYIVLVLFYQFILYFLVYPVILFYHIKLWRNIDLS